MPAQINPSRALAISLILNLVETTFLMSKGNAEKLAEHLKQYHELVEIYYDDSK